MYSVLSLLSFKAQAVISLFPADCYPPLLITLSFRCLAKLSNSCFFILSFLRIFPRPAMSGATKLNSDVVTVLSSRIQLSCAEHLNSLTCVFESGISLIKRMLWTTIRLPGYGNGFVGLCCPTDRVQEPPLVHSGRVISSTGIEFALFPSMITKLMKAGLVCLKFCSLVSS